MNIRPLAEALADKAKNELNENPKTLEADLAALKDWIDKQPHLKARKDDQWLIAFLRGCKYSLERAKAKIDLFYTLRTTASDVTKCMKITDPKFEEILNLGAVVILPKGTDITSPRLIIFRSGVYDADKYHIKDVMFVYYILQLIMMWEDDQAVVSGTETLSDLENVTMGHFLQMTPSLMTKMVSLAQDAMPFRLKGNHFINTPSGFETVFNFAKALLNEKNKSRLYVHNKNYDSLYKSVSKDILPNEYGGNGGTIPDIIEYWKNKVKAYSSWLSEEEQYGSEESKRVGAPKTAESMFGVDGSFRQLQFD